MELYRGYVPIKGKSATRSFKKGEELLTLQQARRYKSYAGVLSEETALLDFDDEEQAETAMAMVEGMGLACQVVATTRGRHLYFGNRDAKGEPIIKRCGNAQRLACGLTADVKVGDKASYAVLKKDGEEREVERAAEEPQAVPAFFRVVEGGPDFTAMEPGDGRNNSLFSYILTLQSEGFTVEECRETIRAINSYVLEEPLDDDEVEKILREDSFKKELFFVKNNFQFDRFAEFIKNRHRVVTINGQLHIYRDGIYTADQRAIEAAMIHYIRTLKDSQRSEVLKYLRIICDEVKETADANLVCFENGLLALETGQLRGFDPDAILTNRIACAYDPEAYDEVMDRTLDKLACGDRQIRALLEECAGYCMYRRNELGKAFMLTGDKSNGKSTFLEVVTEMLGPRNVSNLDVGELGDRFSTVTLYGRLANIGDDVSDEFMKGSAVAMFKKIATGSRIRAEQKGQPVFEFRPYVKLLFSANDIPRMRDKTGAVLRRLVIIPFNATFSKEDPDFDPFIVYKLKRPEALRYLARVAVEGLQRVLANRAFTASSQVEGKLEEYELENDPTLLFFREVEREEVENEATTDVYHRYTAFCAENGYAALSSSAFTKKANAHYGFKTAQKRVQGRRVRVFTEL